MVNNPELKKFLAIARKITNKLSRYSSRFSNKIYDNHQKIIILVFRQKMKMTYRSIVNFLRFSGEARDAISLSRVPDHSPLVKFSKRISAKILESLLRIKRAEIIAIDASGFETECRSYYYQNVWNMKNKRKVRRYLKLSIAVDAVKQIILSYKARVGPRNDHIDFKPILKGLSTRFVVADKGYDSRANRSFVLRMKAYPHIPYRRTSGINYLKNGAIKMVVIKRSITREARLKQYSQLSRENMEV